MSEIAKVIFDKYCIHYDGEVQGCCALIADEIQRAMGGDVVGGYIVFLGSNRRSHWWVEKDGQVIDPMSEHQFAPEDYAEHEEAHRDRNIFERILPLYEQWRLP